jgi:hypothetical protein
MTDIILPRGESNLNSEVYNHAGDLFLVRICWLFNYIYTMGEMPEEWGEKKSIVIPVYKKGEKPNVKNCREISLLNACYKLHGITF